MPKQSVKRNERQEASSASKVHQLRSEERLDEAAVAELAYRRWVEKGCPQGSAEDDWLEAEKALRSGAAAMRASG